MNVHEHQSRYLHTLDAIDCCEDDDLRAGLAADAEAILATLAEDEVTLATALLGEKVLPLSSMASAYLPDPEQTANELTQEAELMGIDTGTTDRLLVQEEAELLAVEGVLESISAAEGEEPPELTFHWREESRSLELSRVRAILLAPAAEEASDDDDEPEPIRGVVLASDGSRLVFTSVSVDDESVTFESPTFEEAFTLPREQVVAIEFASDRLVHLSDLAPDVATTEAQMIDPIEYRTDEALDGGLLTLDGVSYDKGLAFHSDTTLTWELAGDYEAFVAIVGIDDSVRPGGSATLELICDGETVATVTLTGRDDPQTFRCDLDGVQQFTIHVGFGPDGLEVSDHVDLAMARLIESE